jgi:hypothetical protein
VKITITQYVVVLGQFLVEGFLITFLAYLFSVTRAEYRRSKCNVYFQADRCRQPYRGTSAEQSPNAEQN